MCFVHFITACPPIPNVVNAVVQSTIPTRISTEPLNIGAQVTYSCLNQACQVMSGAATLQCERTPAFGSTGSSRLTWAPVSVLGEAASMPVCTGKYTIFFLASFFCKKDTILN